MDRKFNFVLAYLLGGLILAFAVFSSPTGLSSKAKAASPCDLPACAHLVIAQGGQPGMFQAAVPFARPQGLMNSPWKIDTGTPSPNGTWVAYTSVSRESGGPVFLQNVESGDWINLIEKVNAALPKEQPPFAPDYGWDVIGWFPDSARLMIGPLDLSQVVIVDLASFSSQSIPFPGAGRGGRMFVDLAPDGNHVLFIGDDASGDQMMGELEIATGQVVEWLHLPYAEGVLSNPRYSPDQSNVAYLVQTGRPDPGLVYSIYLMSTLSRQSSLLVQDNLTMTVPLWSPDGRAIAFVRREGRLSPPTSKEAIPQGERTNVWVLSLANWQQTQVTFAGGFVRSPAWAKDNRSLAYVMGDGQVGLVDLSQPGKSWQVAGTTSLPELTNVFFLP